MHDERPRADMVCPVGLDLKRGVFFEPGAQGGAFAHIVAGLVRLEEETSNSLIETLADWEAQLKHQNIDFEELSP